METPHTRLYRIATYGPGSVGDAVLAMAFNVEQSWRELPVYDHMSAANALNQLYASDDTYDVRLGDDDSTITADHKSWPQRGLSRTVKFIVCEGSMWKAKTATIYRWQQCCLNGCYRSYCLTGEHSPIRRGWWSKFFWPVQHPEGTTAILKTLPQPIFEEVLEHIKEVKKQ